jgi:adenylate cyclase
LDRALELAQKATSLNEDLLETHCLMGYVYLWKKQHEKAIALYEKVIDLNPNFADGYADLGGILNFAGRPEKAIALIDKAMRLDPLPPVYHMFHLGHAHFLMNRHDEAITALRGALKSNSDFFPARAFLAVTYIELGHEDEAHAEVVEISRRSPETTLEVWQKTLPYKNQELTKRILKALHKAGLK